jgi:hypothetical protein
VKIGWFEFSGHIRLICDFKIDLMRFLRSKGGLKVKGLGDSLYIAWIPNYYGIIPPKLKYKHDLDGNLEFIGTKEPIKGISINSTIMCLVILIINFLENEYVDFIFIYPFLLGIIGFMILSNFLLVETTKWKVDKQRYANKS